MTELAKHGEGEYIPLTTIAERQNISEKYLESIIVILARAGLVDSLRGKGGGYRLNRAPESYTAAEILRAAEGTLAPIACLADAENKCPRAKTCNTLPMWEELDSLITGYLESVTLKQLMG